MSVEPLRSIVLEILHHSDLNNVSLRAIRTMLTLHFASRIPTGVEIEGQDRSAIDGLIRECFDEVSLPCLLEARSGQTTSRSGLPRVVQATRPKRKRKAVAVIGDEEEKEMEPVEFPSVRTREKKPKRTLKQDAPFLRPWLIDERLQPLCDGVKEAPRHMIMKMVWSYVKQNGLQDPNNGRVVRLS